MEPQAEPVAMPYVSPEFSARERELLAPFFTNLDRSAYAITIPNPEVVGAICSRASRATADLREVFLREFLLPFLAPERAEDESDQDWQAKQQSAAQLQELIDLLKQASVEARMANPKARAFFDKWLAQFGDDSIAQMAGTHIAFGALSQVALKHLEDQRIGLAPIEKSTRYVDYGGRVNGRYRYLTPAELSDRELRAAYDAAMDNLFATYADLVPRVHVWLMERHPEVPRGVCEKKAFDLLRGLLPMSALSQVAFFANGQAAEYLITRGRAHDLTEVQWAAERAREEWQHVIPSFIHRVDSTAGGEYQQWLRDRRKRLRERAAQVLADAATVATAPSVRLLDYHNDGEARVIAGLLHDAGGAGVDFASALQAVAVMTDAQKREVLDDHFRGRTQRYHKPHHAFELAGMTFEIVTNNGAYRDLHRHRMLSQQRELFTVVHGYDLPDELSGTAFEAPFREAIAKTEEVYHAVHDVLGAEVAQYAATLAHRVRFIQQQNLRSAFWTTELRTIPEGHPDYRAVEQEKARLISQAYPLVAEYLMADMANYDFARRGQEQKIAAKERALRTASEESA